MTLDEWHLTAVVGADVADDELAVITGVIEREIEQCIRRIEAAAPVRLVVSR